MKKIISVLICAALLTGCAESGGSYGSPTYSSNTYSESSSTTSSEPFDSKPVDSEPGTKDVELDEPVSFAPTSGSTSGTKSSSTSSSVQSQPEKKAESSSYSSTSSRTLPPLNLKPYGESAGSSSTPSSSSSSAPSLTPSSKPSSAPSSASNIIDAISKVCGLKSSVETSIEACIVDIENAANPYDVAYDYGKDFEAYIAVCDWSLVFDPAFYAKEFPLLALQYHDDAALLLRHFQTVGIQEGRQGNANFNVGVYKANCAKAVSSAFGDEYEGYYFYYMLNYASEKSVSAKPNANSKTQQIAIMTALQASELEGINKWRAATGAAPLEFNSELSALAGYRTWTNAYYDYRGHAWLHEGNNSDKMVDYALTIGWYDAFSENTCQRYSKDPYGSSHLNCYRSSKAHYEAAISASYDYLGTSNCYASNYHTDQLDLFLGLA